MSESSHELRIGGIAIPLYVQILLALVAAIAVGSILSQDPLRVQDFSQFKARADSLAIPCDLILKALRALATPLILLAVLHTFLTANIPGRAGRKLAVMLLTNTTVAIVIGLGVANLLQPGKWGAIVVPKGVGDEAKFDPWSLLQNSIPEAVLKPLVDNNVIQLIVIALALGVALRGLKAEQIKVGKTDYLPVEQLVTFLFDVVVRVLGWVIVLIPIAVFGIVAKTIALSGFEPFKALAGLIVAVLLALGLQTIYYLTRVKLGSWVSPQRFLAGGSDAFFTAFSTSSSTITMPITFEGLRDKIGLRESSASLGALVGSNFNNDGTALYEAMAALFIAQMIGRELSLTQQLLVVVTSIFASVGAAGIPNAGLVTMTLVFTSVGLPPQYIAILVTVDWFLDRCRTTINVMGDMTVSCLLDGKKQALGAIDEVIEDVY
jgi:Na+/H+-dicarboxylate symporter